jgi:hypothetical protein
MKLYKASGIKENTPWWASGNYARRLSHEERSKRTHTHFGKGSEIVVPNVPLQEEVEVHLIPDVERGALGARILLPLFNHLALLKQRNTTQYYGPPHNSI